MAKFNNSDKTTARPQEPKLNYFQKIWRYRKYLVVEPFFFFYAAATYLNTIALRNFPLEKACRINLGYNVDTCLAMLDKDDFNITCPDDLTFSSAVGATPEQKIMDINSIGFDFTVCKAEVESQILLADVSGKRAPIGNKN